MHLSGAGPFDHGYVVSNSMTSIINNTILLLLCTTAYNFTKHQATCKMQQLNWASDKKDIFMLSRDIYSGDLPLSPRT